MTGALLHRSEFGTLELSQGALNIDYTNRLPGPFPKGVESRIVITDSSKAILDVFVGELSDGMMNFTVDQARTQAIPAGAQYSWFVTWRDGLEYQWGHGYVVRTEVHWATAPATQIANQPLAFTYVPGSVPGNRWLKKGGTGGLKVFTASGVPNSLGINNSARATAAALWDTPFATDSVKAVVTTVTGGAGKSSVVLCSDINMTSYLAVQLQTGSTNKLHIVRGSGPVTMTDLVTPVSNGVANGETYTTVYDHASKTVAVYKGSSLTPLISWTDETDMVPHGQGYTYGGVNYLASLTSPGTKFSYWSMKDN